MIQLYGTIGLVSGFTWAQALWLEQWELHVFPPGKVEQEIIITADLLDKIQRFFGAPLTITSFYRAPSYNKLIGGAPNSAHTEGKAVDFIVHGFNSDQVRAMLLPKLDEWRIRIENLPGAEWTHVDRRDPGPGGRYFIP